LLVEGKEAKGTILQILEIKQIIKETSDFEKLEENKFVIRFLLSDGFSTIHAVISKKALKELGQSPDFSNN